MVSLSIFLLLQPRCVLIHIPKTGGTSLRKGIWGGNYEGPEFGAVPERWKHEFKFAFVRHPLCRLTSAYRMFTEGAVGDPSWKLPEDARPLSFDAFLDIVLDESIIFDQRRRTFEEKIRHHTIPQTHPFNALSDADFVGRYERLDEDFRIVADRVGLRGVPVPRMHFTKAKPYSVYFNARQLEKMVDYYKTDFAHLQYGLSQDLDGDVAPLPEPFHANPQVRSRPG